MKSHLANSELIYFHVPIDFCRVADCHVWTLEPVCQLIHSVHSRSIVQLRKPFRTEQTRTFYPHPCRSEKRTAEKCLVQKPPTTNPWSINVGVSTVYTNIQTSYSSGVPEWKTREWGASDPHPLYHCKSMKSFLACSTYSTEIQAWILCQPVGHWPVCVSIRAFGRDRVLRMFMTPRLFTQGLGQLETTSYFSGTNVFPSLILPRSSSHNVYETPSLQRLRA